MQNQKNNLNLSEVFSMEETKLWRMMQLQDQE